MVAARRALVGADGGIDTATTLRNLDQEIWKSLPCVVGDGVNVHFCTQSKAPQAAELRRPASRLILIGVPQKLSARDPGAAMRTTLFAICDVRKTMKRKQNTSDSTVAPKLLYWLRVTSQKARQLGLKGR
jgi:hypothetical protein